MVPVNTLSYEGVKGLTHDGVHCAVKQLTLA